MRIRSIFAAILFVLATTACASEGYEERNSDDRPAEQTQAVTPEPTRQLQGVTVQHDPVTGCYVFTSGQGIAVHC